MKKEQIADIVQKTVSYLERTGADRLAQQYLHFALGSFASGCEVELIDYLARYAIQDQHFTTETAQLLIYREKTIIACFILDAHANLIGRPDPETRCYPNVDLELFDTSAKISRRHAQIFSLDGRNFWLEDLGSFNGTLLNNNRLTPHPAQPLHDEDEIVFGNIAVTFNSPIVGKVSPKTISLAQSLTTDEPSSEEILIDASDVDTVN
jgi:FHA domain